MLKSDRVAGCFSMYKILAVSHENYEVFRFFILYLIKFIYFDKLSNPEFKPVTSTVSVAAIWHKGTTRTLISTENREPFSHHQ